MRQTSAVIIAVMAAVCVSSRTTVSARDVLQQQPPAAIFRSAVTLVPVDVRVVDAAGTPVTNLKAEDFTILEDGVRQEIRHFGLQTLATSAPAPGANLALRTEAASFEPQSSRIFLIILGRGRLQEPSKAIDALLRFVRERLLPQDRLAVFAYNRATTFTTDHRLVAGLIERFRLAHEQVDYEIGLQMSGLAAIYGSKLIPKSLQGKIDRMFAGSGLLASQRVDAGAAADKRVGEDVRRQTEASIQKQTETAKADMAAEAGVPNLTTWSALDEISTEMFADLSLDAFVATTAQTLQDLGNIYAGINYLRYFEGEKHLVFFTERGLTLPRAEEDEILAATANDARVVLDTIETGGLYVGQAGGAMPEGRWNQMTAFKTLQTVSELTGGVSSIAEPGIKAMDRLNAITRATYQLGFYPTNPRWDGTYRKVTVKVARPGVTAYFRHGYYGRRDLAAFDRREFMTSNRIRAAASFRREIRDIRVKLDAGFGRVKDGPGYEMTVNASIDPSKLALNFVEGVRLGRLSIAVFCFDEKGNGLSGTMQTADLRLTDDAYKKALSAGIPYRMIFPTNPGVRRVRIVVYDFRADLIGSADTSVA